MTMYKDLLDELEMDLKDEPDKEPPATEPEDDILDDENDPVEPEENEDVDSEEAPKEDPAKKTVSEEKPKEKDDAANKAFAELRAKSTRYERMLKRLAESSNKSLDEFVNELEDKAIERQAKKMGTDPALLKRLEALEEENQRYQEGNIRMYLQSEYKRVESTLKLSEAEMKEFTTQLIADEHDFGNLKVDYLKLYRGYNHDKLVERERQGWIKKSEKDGQAPGTIKPGRRSAGDPGEIATMEDLDRLLDNRGKK
jgi:type I site-specific restriction endonuclease